MKKLLIVIVCLGVIAALAFYFFLGKKKELAIEDILPQEAQLFMRFDHVGENIKEFSQGAFWQSISHIDYDTLVKQEILNPEQVVAIKSALSQLTNPQVHMILDKLFGNEFAFVVYPLNINLSQVSDLSALSTPTFLDDALSNFMIVTRIDADMQLVEFFSGLFGELGQNARQETLNYKDQTVHSIVFDQIGLRISYTRIKDLLVITLGDRAAQKIIDVYLKERPALAQQPNYMDAKKQAVEGQEVTIYWDMGKFVDYIREQATAVAAFVEKTQKEGIHSAAAIEAQINETLRSVIGFETFYISGRLDKITEFKFTMSLDEKKLSPEMAQYYACDPVQNDSLKFVTKDALGYQWNGCVNFVYYWEQILAEIEKSRTNDGAGAAAAENIAAFEQMIGLNIRRELLPAFGDEFGGILQDIAVDGMFPIPQFLLFVEVKDQQKINALLEKLATNPVLMRQQEQYEGATITYFSAPIGGDELQPSYGYIGDYLIIAINRQIIKSALDAQKDGAKSLSASEAFKQIDKGLSDKNMNVFFARLGILANKLEDLIEWANGWAESQQQQRQALKAGSEQRLQIVDNDLKQLQAGIDDLNKQIAEVTAHIEDFKSKSMDTSASTEELNGLNKMVEAKKADMASMNSQRDELLELIGNYQDTGLSAQKRELFLQQLVYPLINGLSSIEAFGGRTTIKDGVFESNMLLLTR